MPVMTRLQAEGRVILVAPRRLPEVRTRTVFRFVPEGAPPPTPPRSVDLRPRCRPIRLQDPLASCTAHSFTAAAEFVHGDGLASGQRLAPLFTYWASRVEVAAEQPELDGGCIPEVVVRALETYGVCLEDHWAYVVGNFDNRPPGAAFADAASRRVPVGYPLQTLRDIKLCLAQGHPVPLAITLARSVHNGENGRAERTWDTGVFPIPADDEPENAARFEGAHSLTPTPDEPDHGIGIHSVLAVGYDDETQLVCVANSWGDRFGERGYGYVRYACFGAHQDADLQSRTSPCFAYDAWTLRSGPNALNAGAR